MAEPVAAAEHRDVAEDHAGRKRRHAAHVALAVGGQDVDAAAGDQQDLAPPCSSPRRCPSRPRTRAARARRPAARAGLRPSRSSHRVRTAASPPSPAGPRSARAEPSSVHSIAMSRSGKSLTFGRSRPSRKRVQGSGEVGLAVAVGEEQLPAGPLERIDEVAEDRHHDRIDSAHGHEVEDHELDRAGILEHHVRDQLAGGEGDLALELDYPHPSALLFQDLLFGRGPQPPRAAVGAGVERPDRRVPGGGSGSSRGAAARTRAARRRPRRARCFRARRAAASRRRCRPGRAARR